MGRQELSQDVMSICHEVKCMCLYVMVNLKKTIEGKETIWNFKGQFVFESGGGGSGGGSSTCRSRHIRHAGSL
jgi:hypothetical protein